jgi:hypothetical protein
MSINQNTRKSKIKTGIKIRIKQKLILTKNYILKIIPAKIN